MKNIVWAALLSVLLCLSVTAEGQVKFGVRGGLNTSSVTGFDKLYQTVTNQEGGEIIGLDTKYKSGYHFGVIMQADIPMTNFFVQPELLFSNQGIALEAKIDLAPVGPWEITTTSSNHLNYFQLPVYVGYKLELGHGLQFILGTGPYFSYGVWGTNRAFSSDNDYKMRRMDFGLTAMGGIQINDKIQITIGYDLGLLNMMRGDKWDTLKKTENLSNLYNRNLKLSVGYFF